MSLPGTAPAKRRRGRPVKMPVVDLSLEEVGRMLRFSPEVLARMLQANDNVLPGAYLEGDEWRVPVRALRGLLQEKVIEPRMTVKEVASALRMGRSTIYEWLELRGPHGEVLLPSHMILGHVRVFVRDVLALPSEWPSWAPRRPSFFSDDAGGGA